ncbi:MAG: hypothetical protein KGH61_05040 [Candidatus Micrarchaeota archaeon]|nr:hypothetical protein [Candidatus Micrarchaeota archaeon]MDE1848280.1 hypothetical protein [Candidatus Micrarchaeota archaeon]MDE1864583.1 hypothetical protein [Candidatus Micrarchaeota archaeon]
MPIIYIPNSKDPQSRRLVDELKSLYQTANLANSADKLSSKKEVLGLIRRVNQKAGDISRYFSNGEREVMSKLLSGAEGLAKVALERINLSDPEQRNGILEIAGIFTSFLYKCVQTVREQEASDSAKTQGDREVSPSSAGELYSELLYFASHLEGSCNWACGGREEGRKIPEYAKALDSIETIREEISKRIKATFVNQISKSSSKVLTLNLSELSEQFEELMGKEQEFFKAIKGYGYVPELDWFDSINTCSKVANMIASNRQMGFNQLSESTGDSTYIKIAGEMFAASLHHYYELIAAVRIGETILSSGLIDDQNKIMEEISKTILDMVGSYIDISEASRHILEPAKLLEYIRTKEYVFYGIAKGLPMLLERLSNENPQLGELIDTVAMGMVFKAS